MENNNSVQFSPFSGINYKYKEKENKYSLSITKGEVPHQRIVPNPHSN